MEKKLIISVAILSILFNIFFFLHISNNIVDNFLLDKTTVSFDFSTNEQVASKKEFLNKIKSFSEENNVEIAQYSFLSADKIDIYSTMKEEYKEILFVPNIIFNRDVKVHNFDELMEVGFKNILYINTDDTNIINRFAETLKDDCKLYCLEMEFETDNFSFVNFLANTDNNSLFLFVFWLFLFTLVIFFYYSLNKKRYFIYKFWGYSDTQIYYVLNKPLCMSLILTILLTNLVVSGIIYKKIFSPLALEVLFVMLKLNLVAVSLISILSIVLFWLFCSVVNNNRKKGLTKLMMVSYVLRILLFSFVIFSSEQFLERNTELQEKVESLTVWENTENLYNLYESYSPYYIDDLVAEDIHNDKIYKVYKELSDSGKAFIMSTTNFERPETEGLIAKKEKDIDYSYKINVEEQEDLYSPYGKNIVVDTNYLNKHIIKSVDGNNVIDMIDNDNSVLNILVPQKYERYENIIESSFKEWFYFQKVEVTNIYKNAREQKKVEQNIDDLSINIIYIENEQGLFTYNSHSGNGSNIIEDSIITVYTENVDNSFLAACMGDYIFIESADEYSAMKEISTIAQKYNIIELNTISSVYDKKGEEIRLVEASRNNLILNTMIMSLFLVMFMIVIMYMYYNCNFSMIIIKSIYGYNFWQIYKRLIVTNSFINIFMLFIVVIVFQKLSFYMIVFSALVTIVDCLVAVIVNSCLITKGELLLITGQ